MPDADGLATRASLARDAMRRRATRWTLITVGVTAVLTYGSAQLLHLDLGSTTVSFAMFASMFGATAAVVGIEVTRYRRCPRCGWQQDRRPSTCPDCGYDVGRRPRWICPDGHAYALQPGLCDCGQRLQPWEPPNVLRPVLRSVALGVAVLVALIITGLLVDR